MPMANPYGRLFSAPGSAQFEVAGFAARMAHLMTVLGVIFFVPAVTGSYGMAGVAAAGYALAYSLASPQLSRLADQHGQGRLLAPTTAANAASRAGFLAVVWLGAPAWSVLALSAVSGATMPAIGPMIRARWSGLFGGSPLLDAALSFESVVDEAILITAPITVAALASYLNPSAGLIMALLLAAAGSAWLAFQRRTEPPVRRSARPAGTALSVPGVPALVLAFIAIGTAQTIIDVGTVAFTSEHRAKPLSGLILALLALGSALSGLWYGTRGWQSPPGQRLTAALCAFTGGTLLFVAAPGTWFLFLAAPLLGFTVAPAMIAGFSIASRSVPEPQLTEGLTWLTASMGIGIALGSAITGGIVDTWGTRPAFTIASCCASASILAAITTAHRPRPASAATAHSPQEYASPPPAGDHPSAR
jgi:Major Facilitator Superfamily